LFCLNLIFTTRIYAEEENTTFNTYLLIGRDNQQNSELLLGADIGLKSQIQLNAGLYRSKDDANTSFTRQNSLGIGSNPYHLISFSFYRDSTIQSSKIEQALLNLLNNPITNTSELKSIKYGLTTNINLDDWQFGITPILNKISLTLPTYHEFKTKTKGINLAITYLGFDNYFIAASIFRSELEDIKTSSNLNPQTRLSRWLLARITQSSASSIEGQNSSIGFGRFFMWGSISYNFQVSHSIEVFQQRLRNDIHSISTSYSLSKVTQLDFGFSYLKDSSNTTIYNTNIGLNYYW